MTTEPNYVPARPHGKCPICDAELSDGAYCDKNDDDHHYWGSEISPTYGYYRYTIDGTHYIIEIQSDMIVCKVAHGYKDVEAHYLPLDSFDFDPKNPKPVIEKLKVLCAYG